MFQASGGIQIEPSWLITTIVTLLGALASVIAFLYRGQVQALKDQIEDLKGERTKDREEMHRLIDQLDRVADVQDRGLSIVEAERASSRRRS